MSTQMLKSFNRGGVINAFINACHVYFKAPTMSECQPHFLLSCIILTLYNLFVIEVSCLATGCLKQQVSNCKTFERDTANKSV